MISKKIVDKSISIFLIVNSYKWYSHLRQLIYCIYQNSKLFRLISGFFKIIKICFRYSFLGRISEIKQPSSDALAKSRAVRFLSHFYKKRKDKTIQHLKFSTVFKLTKDTKKNRYFAPMTTLSIIILTAVFINVLLSIAISRQINLWGWLIRGIFLLVGLVCLLCKTNWLTIKKSSMFLRKLDKN